MTLRDRFIEFWFEEHGSPPPSHWVICSACRGEGASTAYLGAYTQSDREEMGDEWFDYIDDVRAGVYDRTCDECGGSGKVREFTGPAADAFADWEREAFEDARIRAAESGLPYY